MARTIRAGCSGTFYPEDPAELERAVDGLLAEAQVPPPRGEPLGILAPHAGLQYSGALAALSWRALAEWAPWPELIVVLCNAHSAGLRRGALCPGPGVETPLGVLPLDEGLAMKISEELDLDLDASAHRKEHPLETQYIFIQRLFPGVPCLALSLGPDFESFPEDLGRGLHKYLKGKKTLFVASSDLSHYPPADQARRGDLETLSVVEKLDPQALARRSEEALSQGHSGLEVALCGEGALRAVMEACRQSQGRGAQVLGYANSGEITGDPQRAVGYGAGVFYKNTDPAEGLATAVQAEDLLKAAKQSLDSLGKKSGPANSRCGKGRGLFVTLTRPDGSLRGCLGRVESDGWASDLVGDMAWESASQDPRFPAVTEREAQQLEIFVSLLSPLRRARPQDVVAGVHGVAVDWQGRRGLFLPEVASEQGWDRRQLIRKLITEKAGLPQDCLDRGGELYVFTTQVFREKGA